MAEIYFEPFSLGVALRVLREERGLTAADLARRADCSQALVYQYETPPTARRIRGSTFRRIAEALGVSLDYFAARAASFEEEHPALLAQRTQEAQEYLHGLRVDVHDFNERVRCLLAQRHWSMTLLHKHLVRRASHYAEHHKRFITHHLVGQYAHALEVTVPELLEGCQLYDRRPAHFTDPNLTVVLSPAKLRQARLRSKQTLQQIATAMSVTRQRVSQLEIEKGDAYWVSEERAQQLCEVYRASLSELEA